MSSTTLLEQSLIDANTLKEIALKNAEQQLIERHSADIKAAVDKLLSEQLDLDVPSKQEEGNPLGIPTDNVDNGVIDDESADDSESQIPSAILDLFGGSNNSGNDSEEQNVIQLSVSALMGQNDEDSTDLSGMEQGDLASQLGMSSPDQQSLPDMMEREQGFAANSEEKPDNSNIIPTQDQTQQDIENTLSESDNDSLSEEQLGQAIKLFERLIADVSNNSVLDDTANVAIPKAINRERHARSELRKQSDTLPDKTISRKSDLFVDNDKFKKELEQKDEQLKEYQKAVKQLQEVLKKTNLINAKLLYENKVLADTSLNERQKMRIVESLSKSSTAKEAKLIYETLYGSATNGSDKNSSQGTVKKETLNEAVQQRNRISLTARPQAKPADEISNNPIAQRMREMAGIIKKS